MNRRPFPLFLALALSVAACGEKDKSPSLGGNNDNENNVVDDMGGGSIFPDVTINNSQNNTQPNNTNTPIDMGPPDTGVDSGVDASMPDMMSVDMPPDMPQMMNCPRTNVATGQACRCNQECTSGVCVDATVTTDGFCSTTCSVRGDCPNGQACVTDNFGNSVCRQDDTNSSCAQGGQSTPAMCSAGYCVQAGSNFALDHFCSVPCDRATDCQVGHACTPVRCQFTLDGYKCLPTIIVHRAPNKATVLAAYPESDKVCVKVGDANPCQNVMSDEQACQGSLCDDSPSGRCTSQCVATADCPAGGCVDYDLSDGQLPIRVCDL